MKKILYYNPVACPRPRVTRFGTYYPKRYTEFKKAISKELEDVEELRFIVLLFIIKRPKALLKGDQILHHKRPDLDNFIKSILDALPQEDSKIHSIFAQKRYARYLEEPKIVLIGGSKTTDSFMSFFDLLMSSFGQEK